MQLKSTEKSFEERDSWISLGIIVLDYYLLIHLDGIKISYINIPPSTTITCPVTYDPPVQK